MTTANIATMASALDPRHGHFPFLEESVRDAVWAQLQEEVSKGVRTTCVSVISAYALVCHSLK